MSSTGKRIIDFIIEQGEIYDGRNVDIEQEVISKVMELYSRMQNSVLRTVETHGDIDTVLKYQTLCNRLASIVDTFYSDAYKVLRSAMGDYIQRGYDQFGDYIDIGMEMDEKPQSTIITEIAGKKSGKMIDPNAVDFIQKHGFEQVKGISQTIMTQLRSQLAGLYAQGIYDKNRVRDVVAGTMHTNRSRAEMIAQTEMSMAYNSGALERMREFNMTSTKRMKKYWYGFKYSEITCEYCRPRIGTVFDIDDSTEMLPAHPRCRCVWLPFVEGWDDPISSTFTRRADMLKRAYAPTEIYDKINKRLGISYAQYMSVDDAVSYLNGDRTNTMVTKLQIARDRAIESKIKSIRISPEPDKGPMSREFNTQLSFWKRYVSECIVDGNTQRLIDAHTAIKGIMVLPWSGQQLSKWDNMLEVITDYFK